MSDKSLIDAIINYVDTKIEYELASIEEDEDGYRGSCVKERKATESAKEELMNLSNTEKEQ